MYYFIFYTLSVMHDVIDGRAFQLVLSCFQTYLRLGLHSWRHVPPLRLHRWNRHDLVLWFNLNRFNTVNPHLLDIDGMFYCTSTQNRDNCIECIVWKGIIFFVKLNSWTGPLRVWVMNLPFRKVNQPHSVWVQFSMSNMLKTLPEWLLLMTPIAYR